MESKLLSQDQKLQMRAAREQTVLITSRLAQILDDNRISVNLLRYLLLELERAIETCASSGKRTFLFNVQSQFEKYALSCAGIVRKKYPDIKCFAIAPTDNYLLSRVKTWGEVQQEIDGIHHFYSSGKDVHLQYAKDLVKICGEVICFIPARSLAATQICKEAQKSGIPITNIKQAVEQYDYDRPLSIMSQEQIKAFISAVANDCEVASKKNHLDKLSQEIRNTNFDSITSYSRSVQLVLRYLDEQDEFQKLIKQKLFY